MATAVTDNKRTDGGTFDSRNNDDRSALQIAARDTRAGCEAVTDAEDDDWERRERELDQKREPRVAEMLALLADREAERLRKLAEAERDGDERCARFLRRCAPSSRLIPEQLAVRQMQRLAEKHGGWCARCGKDLGPAEQVVVMQIEPWGMAPRCVDCAGSCEHWQSPDRKGDCGGCGRLVVLRNPWAWHRTHIYCCARCRDLVYRKLRQPTRKPVTCAGCGVEWTPSRADARFCSSACRQRDYRVRKTTT